MRMYKILRIISIPVGVGVALFLGFFGFQFIQDQFTRAADVIPFDVRVSSIAPTSATVTWSTAQETTGVIKCGTRETNLQNVCGFESQPVRDHMLVIDSLEPNQTYHFVIVIGDRTFFEEGTTPWTFKTPPAGSTPIINEPRETGFPSPSVSEGSATSPFVLPRGVNPTRAAGLPFIPDRSNPVADSPLILGAPTTAPFVPTCNETDCDAIVTKLGNGCTVEDYIVCRQNERVQSSFMPNVRLSTPIPTSRPAYPTNTLAPTRIPVQFGRNITLTPTIAPTPVYIDDDECGMNYLQATSCTSWSWDSLATKNVNCTNAFYRYVFQCRDTSFTITPTILPDQPTPTQPIWYCNTAFTQVASTSATIPCVTPLPTPAPGTHVYCKVRAEDDENNTSEWLYADIVCP